MNQRLWKTLSGKKKKKYKNKEKSPCMPQNDTPHGKSAEHHVLRGYSLGINLDGWIVYSCLLPARKPFSNTTQVTLFSSPKALCSEGGLKGVHINMSFLRVSKLKATNLPNVDKKGCSDPYTTLQYQGTCMVILSCSFNSQSKTTA